MYFLVAILLIVVIIFGVSSGLQSYATAQQAQAQIETAKVAQVASWENLITILTLALVILFALMVIASVLWIIYKKNIQHSAAFQAGTQRSVATPREAPQLGLNDLIQLEMLRALKALQPPSDPAPHALPAPREEESMDEFPSWLR